MANPLGTKEQREAFREDKFYDGQQHVVLSHKAMDFALDGLDIAQEVAGQLRQAGASFGHREKGWCAHCSYAVTLAKWDSWLEGGSP